MFGSIYSTRTKVHLQYCLHLRCAVLLAIAAARRSHLDGHTITGAGIEAQDACLTQSHTRTSTTFINAMMFSPYEACFSKTGDQDVPNCRDTVQKVVTELLTQDSPKFNQSIDFVNLGKTDGQYSPPSHIGEISSNCPIPPSVVNDDVRLLYDKRRWRTSGDAELGCLTRKGGRLPYLVQGFVEGAGAKLLVVAALLPRLDKGRNRHMLPHLRNVVRDSKSDLGTNDVLLIAETPLTAGVSSFEIMETLGAGNLQEAAVQSTSIFNTCCYPAFNHGGYDRVIANFGRKMESIVPFPKGEVEHWGAPNMHLAIIGSLQGWASQSFNKRYCIFMLILYQVVLIVVWM